MTEREIVEAALAKFGAAAQLQIGMEECCELGVAISHYLRGRTDSVERLAEEVADVELVCQTLRIICKRAGCDVDAVRRNKAERLAWRTEGLING